MKKLYLLFILFTAIVNAQEPFITTWTVNEGDLTIEVPVVYDSENNYTIDFGDGTILSNQTGPVSHTYDTPGLKIVTVSGNFHRIDFYNMYEDSEQITSLEQWGDIEWTNMENAFYGCDNLVINAPDIPDLSQVTNMSGMFRGCSHFNDSISINNWNVSNVTNMSYLFAGLTSFNLPIDNWDVSNVTNMEFLFFGSASFNQPLDSWDVSNVTSMHGMFFFAQMFDQPIGNWDVSSVTDMGLMFSTATHFNQPLNNWNVSNVTNMDNMFSRTSQFNQPLGDWDVTNVTSMDSMFSKSGFNQPLNSWDVSNVTNMRAMFDRASNFNQPINNWDISNVTSIHAMFNYAIDFNQDISSWNFNSILNFDGFGSNDGFIKKSGLDPNNYEAFLLKCIQSGLYNKDIDANGLEYCDSGIRNYLIEQLDWTINNDTQSEECQGNSISGNVIYDENADGCDIEDPLTGNFLVNANNGEFTYSTISSNGEYDLSVMEGTYTVELLNVPDYYTVNPPSSNVDFTGFGNEEELNFCLTANETISDLNITLLSIDEARPGFESHYQLVVQNIGTQTITNVSANLIYNETIQSFVESSQAPATTTANQLTFDLATLLPFESKVIDFTMETFTPPTVNGGETISFTASVTPDTGDYTPNDNIYNLEQLVVNSYDPNDKRVMQGEEIYIEDTDEYLDYVIRFQNTGTASAITVRIEDLLHPNLDWTTFTPVTASHDYRIEITDGNQVEFIFDNINLPHEAADEAGSNGFVAYKIKPVEDIQIGDMITGTASIFFDYNLPIITNSADTEVMEFLGVNNYELNTVSVYPNPTKGTVHFNALNNTSIESIKIYNLQGSEIMAFEGYQESIDVQNLSTGIYLLNIQTDKGISRHRLIKE